MLTLGVDGRVQSLLTTVGNKLLSELFASASLIWSRKVCCFCFNFFVLFCCCCCFARACVCVGGGGGGDEDVCLCVRRLLRLRSFCSVRVTSFERISFNVR